MNWCMLNLTLLVTHSRRYNNDERKGGGEITAKIFIDAALVIIGAFAVIFLIMEAWIDKRNKKDRQ